MASAKDKHYWKQLWETLTAGRWDHPSPARTPGGAPLSWSELLRKFNKHCVGNAHIAELASQSQALSLLLSADASDRSLDGNDISKQGSLLLGQECMLPEERVEEAAAGYNALLSIASNSDSIRLAVAYYAYALRRPSECLSILAEVKSLKDVQTRSPEAGASKSTLLAPSGTTSTVSTLTGSNVSSISVTSVAEIGDGTTWSVTEKIRSISGMSTERISPEDPQTSFNTYLVALPLVACVASDIPLYVATRLSTPAAGGVGALDSSTFGRYRELWRWVERLLRRAIILGSRLCDVCGQGEEDRAFWRLLDCYHTCSTHWPPTFRAEHRSTVAMLHLRAFVLRANAGLAATPLPTTREGGEKSRKWVSAARSVVQEYRAILSVSTRFPRAGERNVRVEDLVDLCVAIWEADGAVGEYAGWVIDVLWWATRLTFNSHKIFRHMTRLLYVSGDPELAKRTLRLYVQIVSKARETKMAEVHTGNIQEDEDIDTDRNWVHTLIQGARMLCRLSLVESESSPAIASAKEAGVMIDKAKTRLNQTDKELVANVRLAEGIWHSVTAQAEQDPHTRMSRFADALSCLLASAETFSTPSVQYHLALAYARPGPSLDLQKSIASARLAVEGEPGEIRYWHLLGLLLTATGDWKAARGVLEVGAGVGEADAADDSTATQVNTQINGTNGVHAHDYAVPMPNGNAAHGHAEDGPCDAQPATSARTSVLDVNAVSIPSSATLLRPTPDRPCPSRHEAFEHALQLRMTQLTLTEYVEGPEGASDRWVEIFHWFSERRDIGVDDKRLSIDSRGDTRAPSIAPSEKPEAARPNEMQPPNIYLSMNAAVDEMPTPSTPIPIMITPASPGVNSPEYVDGEETSNEKRSSSFEGDHNRDISRGKKVKEVLKSRVHKSQAGITRISKKIGHNVGRHGGMNLKRTNSTPDLHAVLGHSPYQASSIHLRQHLSIYSSHQDLSLLDAPPPPPPPPPPPSPPSQSPVSTMRKQNYKAAKDRRLLSNLWLMSAATFRRLGKIEQAKAAIQEAEVKDEANPAVWLGLYYMALNDERRALEAFKKALFISPDDVSATVHLCRLYLISSSKSGEDKAACLDRDSVDLAVGLLSDLTRGAGWDVPEAWYFLAKQYGLQGRKDRERECLSFALTLSETRSLRDIGVAVGWCL
ncbi:uncharacterized protein FIBRA_05174 [Fibroporia radiculosa]|uniref:Uncharacterized protein n=1 Tax=Fibroporia radiculosa TaxID=599839 RepID=J4GQI4_9APHY|nr:uncharacterized protein FIBRA_05174 [Fibroporia radiculosa]CCM03055.1 predicted protein [Fibroporia radiculosa]